MDGRTGDPPPIAPSLLPPSTTTVPGRRFALSLAEQPEWVRVCVLGCVHAFVSLRPLHPSTHSSLPFRLLFTGHSSSSNSLLLLSFWCNPLNPTHANTHTHNTAQVSIPKQFQKRDPGKHIKRGEKNFLPRSFLLLSFHILPHWKSSFTFCFIIYKCSSFIALFTLLLIALTNNSNLLLFLLWRYNDMDVNNYDDHFVAYLRNCFRLSQYWRLLISEALPSASSLVINTCFFFKLLCKLCMLHAYPRDFFWHGGAIFGWFDFRRKSRSITKRWRRALF